MADHKSCDFLLDYFNDSLTEMDKSRFEAHLSTCKKCEDELRELNMLTEDLPYSADLTEPNEGMKNRILSSILAENEHSKPKTKEEEPTQKNRILHSNFRWLQPLLAASLLLSLSANAYFYFNQPGQESTYVPREGTDEIVKQVQLAVSEGYEGKAEAAMIKKENGMTLVLQASKLKPISGNEAYQVWLIDETGEKFRAGTFRTNTEGKGAVTHAVNNAGAHKWTTIAVTLEPSPDSKQPKGEIVLASGL